ncbi:hypothetical protein ASG01_05465 [Chryseobacterium sp. Leaf180]|uniref:energy transducer TonB n=1 Tax=Chryseobacterium sp. Leaf180 TaxID=1736289 RepID=UPI0006FC77AD|nr:hypothetical protein [Chryseobacterium sp. Leaf180]KQR95293.1 hypothetical protein ASG01_05465 [Chryseobacterium sp. Leaf180]
MKKLFFISLISCSFSIPAQETKPYPLNNQHQKETAESNSADENVDTVPEYPGGLNAFRQGVANTMKMNKIKGKGTFKSEVSFVIERDGTMTGFIATGNNPSFNEEFIRTLKNMSAVKWIPATINNYAVRYRMRFPMTANIE